MSLLNAPLHATVAVKDIDRAREFYEQTLGFTPDSVNSGGAFYTAGKGTRFLLYPSGDAGTNRATYLGFEVPDIEAEVRDLTGRGIRMEHYEGHTNEEGIADTGPVRSAWFKDPDGNIVGIVQLSR
ncbi:MAG TPA: VOC family protein [Actinomycetota bacterium]|jgi:catechol 2,3-dioxygenase-like lactoylglutathione lyase family enzyme